MRALSCLALTACFARMPEPQPPRTVCNGAVYPAGYVVGASSTCYHLPADRCFDDDSEECEAEAEERRQHNERAASRERTALLVLAATALVLVTVAIASAD